MTIFSKHQYSSPKHPQDSFFRRIWNDPYFDWPILIIVLMVCSITYIAIGVFMHKHIEKQISSPVTPFVANRSALFDAGLLSRVLKEVNDRAEENAAALKGYTKVADPSI